MLKLVIAALMLILLVPGVFAADKQDEINAKLTALLEKQDRRLDASEARHERTEGQMNRIDARLASIERRLETPPTFNPSSGTNGNTLRPYTGTTYPREWYGAGTPPLNSGGTATLVSNENPRCERCNCSPSRNSILTQSQQNTLRYVYYPNESDHSTSWGYGEGQYVIRFRGVTMTRTNEEEFERGLQIVRTALGRREEPRGRTY